MHGRTPHAFVLAAIMGYRPIPCRMLMLSFTPLGPCATLASDEGCVACQASTGGQRCGCGCLHRAVRRC